MQNRINEIKKNEEGAALVLAMMVLLVLAVLGAAVGTLTVGSYRLSDNNKDYNSAYYIAEAGANMAYAEIESYVVDAYDDSESKGFFFDKMSSPLGTSNNLDSREYNDFGEYLGDNPEASVTITPGPENGNTKEFTITSIGEVAGKTRVVTKPIKLNWVESTSSAIPIPLIDNVITFRNTLTFGNNTEVKGDIRHDGTGKIIKGNNFTHKPENGKVISDPAIDWVNYDNIIDTFFTEPEYTSSQTFNKLNISIMEDTFIPKISLSNNDNLTINTNGRHLNLIINEISTDNNNSINVIGNGSVNVYVKNKLSFNGNNLDINNNGNTNQINLFYKGDNNIEFGNNVNLNGTIFIQKANLTLGNNIKINGYIISGGQTINFGNNTDSTPLIFAPKADLYFGNNETFKGAIIAESIIFGNNTDIEYKKASFTKPPDIKVEDNLEADGEKLIVPGPAIEH